MTTRIAQIAGAVLVLLGAAAAGWLVTNRVQDNLDLRSDLVGCWRLEGTLAQTECLSTHFVDGADDAAGARSGASRDAAVVAYVERQEDEAAADPQLAGLCHPAMHQLGRDEGGRAADENRVPTFPEGSSQLCTAGYVHGLAEGYLVGTPDADVASVFPKLCHDADAREGCAHGVGHALLRAHGNEAINPATNAATTACARLPADFPVNCLNGVYMELAIRTEPAVTTPAQFVEACRATGDVDQSLSCWSYLGLSLSTNDVGIDDVPAWCAKADLPGQYACVEEHGRDLGVSGVKGCERVDGNSNLVKRCIDGSVALQVGSGHVARKDALDHCSGLSTTGLREHCADAVHRYLRGRAKLVGA